MKKVALFLIRVYQKTISPDHSMLGRITGRAGMTCIYYPTCSEYAVIAINRFGVWKGSRLAIARIARCHPGNEPGVDEVPEK